MNFRAVKIGRKFLLTSDSGCWDFFSGKEFSAIMSGTRVPERAVEKGFVLSDKNINAEVIRLGRKYSFLSSGPSLHIVIPTLRCNEKCSYCQAGALPLSAKNADMSDETVGLVVTRIFEAGFPLTIEFQGGEPLLRFDIVKRVAEKVKAERKAVKFSLATNLLLMNDEIARFLAENNFGVCTSLDAPDSCRSHREKTVFWIKKLKALFSGTGASVSALSTITKSSLPFWKELIDEYVALGLEFIHLRPVKLIGFAKEPVPADDFINFWVASMDYIIRLNEDGMKIAEREAVIMLKRILFNDSSYADLRSPCGAVIGQIVYNYDGRIYSCDEGRMVKNGLFCVGSIDSSLKSVVSSPESMAVISASINDSYWCNGCAFKPFCGVCPVLNYAEFGSVIGRLSESSWCRIKKAQFAYLFSRLQEKDAGKVLRGWAETFK
jgi:His-Xaa-Ser system radical SAM maturase HxsB